VTDPPTRIRALVRRAVTLRREIVGLAIAIAVADALAATECVRFLGHPTVRMGLALATAVAVVVTSITIGRSLEHELFLVRGEAVRTLAAQLED
jgi:replication-associated recombination protein RarA